MRAVVQRVAQAQVTVDGEVVGRIGPGLLALVGVTHADTHADATRLATKLAGLRLFPGPGGDMDASVADHAGAVLVVSQFTLYGDTRKGRRPSWLAAAPPDVAEPLVEAVVAELRRRDLEVATGRFRAMMQVSLVNDGPVTVLVDT